VENLNKLTLVYCCAIRVCTLFRFWGIYSVSNILIQRVVQIGIKTSKRSSSLCL